MKLKGLLLLAGNTARSQAYAQGMATTGYMPENVIIYGPEKVNLPGQVDRVDSQRVGLDLFTPDLNIPLKETCKKNRWPINILSCSNINDEEIVIAIKNIAPLLIVYSGYGGQLVGNRLLDLGIPFVHIYSGWLPGYRGSTTLYYSWIKENKCGASAIILSPVIDMGPIIARKRYPPPTIGIDPDYIYDSSIRTDLLLKVLRYYSENGRLPEPVEQSESAKDKTYYVIHPVLKHLARLSNEEVIR